MTNRNSQWVNQVYLALVVTYTVISKDLEIGTKNSKSKSFLKEPLETELHQKHHLTQIVNRPYQIVQQHFQCDQHLKRRDETSALPGANSKRRSI